MILRLHRIALAKALAAFSSAALSLARPTVAEPVNHSNALWRVVHDLCVPDQELLGAAAPCETVDLAAGYALVADPGGARQLLLVPTRRITGIEDRVLTQPGGPNYWRQAWMSRHLLERRLHMPLPRTQIGLAVNSVKGRSQEQLHIHISCIQPHVAQTLRAAPQNPGRGWLSLRLDGRMWRMRSLRGETLDADPFKLAAAAAKGAPMQWMTLVVVGAQLRDGRPGFYLLYRLADPHDADPGHGEFLLDESCRQQIPPPARTAAG